MSIVRWCGAVLVMLGALGCGRVAPGTTGIVRPVYISPQGTGQSAGSGSGGNSAPAKSGVNCSPQEKGRYSPSMCRN